MWGAHPSPHVILTYKALEAINALAIKENGWVSFDFDQLPITDDGNVYKIFLITDMGGASDREGFRVCILLNDAGATCWLDMHMRTWSSLPNEEHFEKTGDGCCCLREKQSRRPRKTGTGDGGHYLTCWERRYYSEIVEPGLTEYRTVKGRAWPQDGGLLEKEQDALQTD